jgi:hypothetical protein
MKILVALALVSVPTLAAAQFIGPSISVPQPSDGSVTMALSESYRQLGGNHETPTMRRQKREQAVALRQEYAALLEQDGGTLTDDHRRYVEARVRGILNYQR